MFSDSFRDQYHPNTKNRPTSNLRRENHRPNLNSDIPQAKFGTQRIIIFFQRIIFKIIPKMARRSLKAELSAELRQFHLLYHLPSKAAGAGRTQQNFLSLPRFSTSDELWNISLWWKEMLQIVVTSSKTLTPMTQTKEQQRGEKPSSKFAFRSQTQNLTLCILPKSTTLLVSCRLFQNWSHWPPRHHYQSGPKVATVNRHNRMILKMTFQMF